MAMSHWKLKYPCEFAKVKKNYEYFTLQNKKYFNFAAVGCRKLLKTLFPLRWDPRNSQSQSQSCQLGFVYCIEFKTSNSPETVFDAQGEVWNRSYCKCLSSSLYSPVTCCTVDLFRMCHVIEVQSFYPMLQKDWKKPVQCPPSHFLPRFCLHLSQKMLTK